MTTSREQGRKLAGEFLIRANTDGELTHHDLFVACGCRFGQVPQITRTYIEALKYLIENGANNIHVPDLESIERFWVGSRSKIRLALAANK